MTIYRQPQPAPTEAGWYYARSIDSTQIRPVHLRLSVSGVLFVAEAGYGAKFDPSDWEWFGPVPQCEEG